MFVNPFKVSVGLKYLHMPIRTRNI